MRYSWDKIQMRYMVFIALGAILAAGAWRYGNPMSGEALPGNRSVTELRQAIHQTQLQLDQLPQRLIRESGGTLGHRTLRNELTDTPAWLEIDFGEVSSFDLIALIPMVNIDENQKLSDFGFPSRYQITRFNGGEDRPGHLLFDSINRTDSIQPHQSPILIECPETTARRIRITALEPSIASLEGTAVFALAEVLVFRGYQNIAIGKPVAANYPVHFRPIYEPSYATDGYMPFSHPRTVKHGRTNYGLIRPETGNAPLSIIIDLGSSFPVDEVRLFPVHLGNNFSIFHRTGLGFPRQFSIEISADSNFTTFDTIFETGKSDYPPPGHRLAIFSADGKAGRYVRITSTELPPDPFRGTPVFAFAEIEVISHGQPVSHDTPVTVIPDHYTFNSRAHRLVDGLSSHGEIPLLRDWLVQLSGRNRLELDLATLKEALTQQTLRQSRLLQFLTWVVGLGIPFFAVIVIWQRLIELRHLNRLREDLAADLHDEIGGNFSGIALLCDQLSGANDMPSPYIRQLEAIAKTSRDSAHNTRNLVSFLESHNIQGELVANLESTAALLLTHIPYEFSKTGSRYIEKLTPKEKWHLLLFFKEALANIIKHAGATRVTLNLTVAPGRLDLSISDNGRGFETNHAPIRLPAHLKSRAQKLDGQATLTSSTTGTTITLTKKI